MSDRPTWTSPDDYDGPEDYAQAVQNALMVAVAGENHPEYED